MNILKNIAAIILGLIIGSSVNMGLIMLSSYLIALPEGVNPSDIESIKNNFHLYQPKHFVMPFLAHALGTLMGAFATAKIAATRKKAFALIIGAFFLMGGIQMAQLLPGPLWFNILDLGLAYIPMGLLGAKLAKA